MRRYKENTIIHLLGDDKKKENYVVDITSKELYSYKVNSRRFTLAEYSGVLGVVFGVPIVGFVSQYLYIADIELIYLVLIFLGGIFVGGVFGISIFRYIRRRRNTYSKVEFLKLHPSLKKYDGNNGMILKRAFQGRLIVFLIVVILLVFAGIMYTFFLLEKNLLILMFAVLKLSLGIGLITLVEGGLFILRLYQEEKLKKSENETVH